MIDRQRAETLRTQDTLIQQKVMAAHRQAFAEKYPGQVEHSLRLLMERLQLGLDKRAGVDPADATTWRLSATELCELSTAVYYMHLVRESLQRNDGS